jgi:hypothetical protein
MAVNVMRAMRLLTIPERQLVRASGKSEIGKLTPQRLKQKLGRARHLRDKYRDLAQRQRGEARGKRKARRSRPAKGNRNTVAKADLFALVVERLRQALARKTGTASVPKGGGVKQGVKARRRRKRGIAAKARRTRGKRKSSSRASTTASRHARKAAKLRHRGVTKIQAHAGARGRRRQGKRDARGRR